MCGVEFSASVRLETTRSWACVGAVGPAAFKFEERYHLTKAPYRWFEGPIKFINRQNEATMRAASEWLTAHPEYRADLVAPEDTTATTP